MTVKEIKNILGIAQSVESKFVEMTPELAETILQNCNLNNRKISYKAVNRYKKMINEGHWEKGTDSIGFDDDGILINGQHRLTALSECKKSVIFNVVFGVTRTVNMDTGVKRSFKDNMIFADALDERLKGNKAVGEISLSLYRLVMTNSNAAPDHNDVLKFVNKYADDLLLCDSKGFFDKIKIKGCNSPAVKAAFFTAYKSGVSVEDLEIFVRVFASNEAEDVVRDRPVTACIITLINLEGQGSSKQRNIYNIVLDAIYKFVNGTTAKRITFNKKSPRYVYDYSID